MVLTSKLTKSPSTTRRGAVRSLPVVVAILIAYGSLYPFHFVVPDDFSRALVSLLADRSLWTSLSDVLGNIGLFVPFGLAVAWRPARDVPWHRAALGALVVGSSLALALQAAQLCVPTRSAAISDVLWNGAGTFMGVSAGLLLRRFLIWDGHRLNVPITTAFALLALWVVAQLAPFVPSLDVDNLKESFKALFINPTVNPVATLYTAAQALLVARLLSDIVGAARAARALAAMLLAVLIARLLVVDQLLDWSTTAGFLIAFVIWISTTERWRLALWPIGLLLLATYSLQALAPFALRGEPSSFSWIPFATSLNGSMLANLRALALASFSLTGCVWLIRQAGIGAVGGSIALGAWVLLLEAAQTWIVGRTAGITEPILAAGAGVLLHNAHSRDARTSPHNAPGDTSRIVSATAHRLPSLLVPSVVMAVAIALFAVGSTLVLRRPELPYYASDLFLNRAGLLPMAFFALTLLWIGAGAALVAHRVPQVRRPYALLPVCLVFVSLVSYELLSCSVTYETIEDVIGPNVLFSLVTRDGIWGSFWQRTLLATDALDAVDFIERRVRYTALYSPVVLCIALALLSLSPLNRRTRIDGTTLVSLVAMAIPWLWLSHAIVIDWAATGTITELVSQHDTGGLYGQWYLYAVVICGAVNVGLVIRSLDRSAWWTATIAFWIVSMPIGWRLVSLGLEQHVRKYGYTYSAAQFLLGPDRQQTISDGAFLARWAVIHTGALLAIALGAWILLALVRSARSPYVMPTESRTE